MTTGKYPHKERNRRFCEAAELLYGKRWGRRLAAGIRTPQPTIASIATGQRAVTAELENKLAMHILFEIHEWEERSLKLMRMSQKLLNAGKDIEE